MNTLLQLCLILQPHTEDLYFVGGCVRDTLLGKIPKDYDLVINGDLDIVEKNLLDNDWKVNNAGKQFLVLIASKHGQQFEIAAYRKDGTYTDGRRPDFVDIGTIEEDATRRDFAINSMYMCPFTGKIIDPTGKGLKDLENKVLRFNGKAKDRIEEDYLRIMRMYRFSTQLGFTIEPKALKLCRTYFNTMIATVAPERIRLEVEKMSNL